MLYSYRNKNFLLTGLFYPWQNCAKAQLHVKGMIPKNWNFKVALCAPEVQRLLTSNWSEIEETERFFRREFEKLFNLKNGEKMRNRCSSNFHLAKWFITVKIVRFRRDRQKTWKLIWKWHWLLWWLQYILFNFRIEHRIVFQSDVLWWIKAVHDVKFE